MTIKVVRTSIYQRACRRIMTEQEILSAEAQIISAPAAWPVIPGGGGIRKARVARGGKGKSGGARIIYSGCRRVASSTS
ncbi:MAG TPA: addiction module toxin RelE [Reyranella sp.]|nr:addiction module toxin RelE [Reyranella sp.]